MSSVARSVRLVVLAGLAVAGASSSVMAQPVQQPPCAGAEFRQLDFWLGEWDARWDASPGQPAGSGRNQITRDFDNCVIHEHFDGGASTGNLRGESWSVYHAPAQRWRQTWVDNQGGYFALTGGPEQSGKFVLVSYGLQDNQPHQRMVFEDITPTSFTWRWQRTSDNGATWADSWVIHYTRRTSH
jgi:hypothetical protein